MQQPQLIFDRVIDTKRKIKDIKQAYKDALSSSLEHKELSDKLKTIREKKKQIETAIKQDFSSEITKLEDLQIDLNSDQELLSDSVMTKLMKGETVEITDKYENKYEPIFIVRFKKS